MQPSGNLHLGNYLGAIKNFVDLQNEENNQCVYCVVDLHAITVKQSPNELKDSIVQVKDLKLGRKLSADISSNEEWKEQPAQFPVKREELVKKILELLRS